MRGDALSVCRRRATKHLYLNNLARRVLQVLPCLGHGSCYHGTFTTFTTVTHSEGALHVLSSMPTSDAFGLGSAILASQRPQQIDLFRRASRILRIGSFAIQARCLAQAAFVRRNGQQAIPESVQPIARGQLVELFRIAKR